MGVQARKVVSTEASEQPKKRKERLEMLKVAERTISKKKR
jgi:hypothetical protein